MDSEEIHRKACSLIVILGYDVMDFLDDVPNTETEVLLKALEYLPLQNGDETTRDVGISTVRGQLKSRGVEIPEPTQGVADPEPTWCV